MVLYVCVDVRPADEEVMKGQFKAQEAKATAGGVSLSELGSYRSAKSVILKAIELEVPLLAADGKPRGKTEVEADIKALKTPETPIETLTRAYALIAKKMSELTTTDEANAAYILAKNAFAQAEKVAGDAHAGAVKAA
jgi:hypothetical protein